MFVHFFCYLDEITSGDTDAVESIKHNEFVDIDMDEEEEEENIETESIRLKRTEEEMEAWGDEGVCEGSLTPSQHSQPLRDVGEGVSCNDFEAN